MPRTVTLSPSCVPEFPVLDTVPHLLHSTPDNHHQNSTHSAQHIHAQLPHLISSSAISNEMSKFADKAIAHERRRAGETALSDFADYVEKQQRRRQYPGASGGEPSTSAAAATHDEHDELDILETLGLADESEHIKLKELLLNPTDDNRTRLKDLLSSRIDEGRGETLFDIGAENNGESMALTLEEYGKALAYVLDVARDLKAGVRVLLSKNTSTETDVESPSKDSCSKVMIRRQPDSIDELLEIRVAVVGNGLCLLRRCRSLSL